MRVWLITIGEPLPTDPGSPRLLRTGLLAEHLLARGHEVDWWSSTFDHMRKTHRASGSVALHPAPRYRLLLLAGTGYRRNVSLRRWADHWLLARRFRQWCRGEPRPELIVCSLPSLELAREAARYAMERRVPLVLDLRDMWPDIFLEHVPRALRPLARPALAGPYADLRYACAAATAITGITPEFVDWGLLTAGRKRSAMDRHFWLAYTARVPPEAELTAAARRWAELDVRPDAVNPLACFFGSLSGAFDMETVIAAAARLGASGSPIRFVLCGTGDRLAPWQRLAAGTPNVVFPGWVNRAEIWMLLRASLCGLAPYHSRYDFVASLPTKSIEYLSAGLPVASSLQGALQHLLERTGAGFTYPNRDPLALASGLTSLHASPARRDRMAAAAAAVYDAEFVAEKVYDEMAGYLEAIGASRSTG